MHFFLASTGDTNSRPWKICKKTIGLVSVLAWLSLPSFIFGQIDSAKLAPVFGVGDSRISALNLNIKRTPGSFIALIAAATPHKRAPNFPLSAYVFGSDVQPMLNSHWVYKSHSYAQHLAYISMNMPTYEGGRLGLHGAEPSLGTGQGSSASGTGYAVASVSPSATGHDEVAYGPSSTYSRANLTKRTEKCLSSTTTCTDVVTHYNYDETGQIVSTSDPNDNVTMYSYADSYSNDNGVPSGNTNAYLTSITGPSTNGITHNQSFTYGFNDGKVRTQTDENANVSTYCYFTGGCAGSTFDPWMRITQVSNPDGGGSSVIYFDAGPNPYMTTTATASPSPSIVTKTVLDQLGRPIQSQLLSDPSGVIYTDTIYSGLGRVYSVSTPYRTTTDLTYGKTTVDYDALGRPTSQTNPDSTSVTWSYLGNMTTSNDELGRVWQRSSDAMGRLKQVMEPGNIETDYVYDGLGNLLCVEQHGGASGTGCTSSASSDATSAWRPRRFTYDSLSRLLSSSNPESGTICYGTRSNSNCIGGYDANGNLLHKTDARGVVTSYAYDALNRLVSKSYSDATPRSCFYYDAATNGIGRLSAESTQLGVCPSTPTTNGFLTQRSIVSYDALGRTTLEKQCTPANCTGAPYFFLTQYNLAGSPIVTTSGTDTVSLSPSYDSAGHLDTVVVNTKSTDPFQPLTLFKALSYGPAGITKWTMGNPERPPLTIEKTYDSRFRPTGETVTGHQ